MTAQELIDALEEHGYQWREYSGRSMYGKQCVGVDLSSDADLWNLARALADFDVKAPKTDSMGRGIIAYWPNAKLEPAKEETNA